MADPVSGAYDVGDVAVVTVTVKDESNALVDSAVTVRYLKPGATFATSVTATQALDATGAAVTGTYEAEVPLDTAGTWQLDAKTTGDYQAAIPGSLHVRTPKIA
jgi:hypothetical protein